MSWALFDKIKGIMMTQKQENKEQIQETLNEIKTTLRLMPQDRRSTLMDFIVEEREHGASYITDCMMNNLTAAFVVYEQIDGVSAQKKPLLNDILVVSDSRQLVYMDDNYPLFMECFNGKTDDVWNKIQRDAKVLCALDETDMRAFAQEVCAPDTPEETVQKAQRHSEVEKMAYDLHYKKYKTDKYYKAMIDCWDGAADGQSVQVKKTSKVVPVLGALAILGAIGLGIYGENQDKQEKTPKQPVPQVQKITDQKKGTPEGIPCDGREKQ